MNTDDFPGPLFTDLYELTMAAGYFHRNLDETATFSLFIRSHPKRSYFVSAGLQPVVDALSRFRFSKGEIAWLAGTGQFDKAFLDHLSALRFTGDVMALDEGEIFFPNEPVMEITAPLIEAQLLETYLINAMGSACNLATKAARCVQAAGGRPIVDFSLRRTQGVHAGMTVARSSYIAGFTGTSNVLAGKRWGIPTSGTMAHSFVTAFGSEIEAFEAYADLFPDNTILLIDTYDILKGAENAVTVARRMEQKGHTLKGIRIDSGDMVIESQKVRRILDEAGLPEVKIFASNGFDEYVLTDLFENGACIDALGVGTRMGVSEDAPYLDMVYKMVRVGKRDVRKQSQGKATLAGKKQVFRKTDDDGRFDGDIIAARWENMDGAHALLKPVMQNGRATGQLPALEKIRERFGENFARLKDCYKLLESPDVYPVGLSERLVGMQN